MATPCPCGCGRKISFVARGTARQYGLLVENLSQLRDLETQWRSEGLDTRPFVVLLPDGERIEREILDYLHKVAKPATHTDLVTLAHQLQAWNEAWKRAGAEILSAAPN